MNVLIGQDDTFQGHEHRGRNLLKSDNITGQGGQSERTMSGPTTGITSDGINGNPRVGTETRPKNISVNYWKRIS